MSTSTSTIRVDVVSAEELIFSGEARFVALPGEAGELGIYPRHTPLITRIKPGAVRIEKADGTEEFVFVAGGLLEIETGTWRRVAKGTGVLGIGGAIGDGTAIYAGYQGRPGTFTVAVKVCHAVPITEATTLVYFNKDGVFLGPLARIRGVSGGPRIWPPAAIAALITMPLIVAVACHCAHAPVIARVMSSMKPPTVAMCCFCVST